MWLPQAGEIGSPRCRYLTATHTWGAEVGGREYLPFPFPSRPHPTKQLDQQKGHSQPILRSHSVFSGGQAQQSPGSQLGEGELTLWEWMVLRKGDMQAKRQNTKEMEQRANEQIFGKWAAVVTTGGHPVHTRSLTLRHTLAHTLSYAAAASARLL